MKDVVIQSKAMDGYQFIDKLFKNGLIKRSLYEWIQFIWVYTDNEVVYKVVVQFEYRTLKKAKKYGVTGEWQVVSRDSNEKLNLDNDKMKTGKMMMKFDAIKRDITYWSGEDY